MTNYHQRNILSYFAIVTLIYSYMGAADHIVSCGESITSCGCTITQPGIYVVDADLSASQGLTSQQCCIDIDACDVRLFTNGHSITGTSTGTGSGIHILSSAWDVFIEGNGISGRTSTLTTISGWRYGLRSAGTNVISDDFQYNNNTVGVFLNGATNNNINDFSANSNTVYGVWIKNGSTKNQIDCAEARNNGIAGTYVGCSATGPTGSICSEEEETSRHNFIFDMGNSNNNGFGLALENGSRDNLSNGHRSE